MIAFYDNKPSIFEVVGNGSFLYRWDIKEIEKTLVDGDAFQWQCNEVIVWPPLTPNKITETVICELWSPNYEQKLINEYNTAVLGLLGDVDSQERIDRYKDFLLQRESIKAMVDADSALVNQCC